jgi:excisionase family DNA binding protein
MKVDEVASLLGVSRVTIATWARMNFIPHEKLGRVNKFRRAEIMRWLESRSDAKQLQAA